MKKRNWGILVVAVFLAFLICACGSTSEGGGECSHSYGMWSVSREATCDSEGIQSRTCEKCGYRESNSIAALGHTNVLDKDAVAATCTVGGSTEQFRCSVCNVVTKASEVVPATGHTVSVTVEGKAPTCTQTGWSEESSCTVCGEKISEKSELAALGHNEVIDKAVAATCTESGLTEGSHCSVCNKVLTAQNTVDAKGHKAVTDKAVAATCTKEGKTEGSHCSVCDKVLEKQESTPMVDHKPVTDKAVAATCSKEGKTEGSHCSVCGKVLEKQESTPKIDHTPVTDKAVAATCAKEGKTEGSHCSVCGTVIQKQSKISKLTTHTYSKGYCTVCGTKDPNYTPTYGLNETWTVPGLIEFTVTGAVEHGRCSTGPEGFDNDQIVMLNIKYKVLGSGSFKLRMKNLIVADEQDELGRLFDGGQWDDLSVIYCDHGKAPVESSGGLAASCAVPYALSNKSSTVTIIIKWENNGQTYTGRFEVPISPKPAEPEEDKLEGCTFTVDNTLPKTINYYDYNDKIESACSVTDISFEVSGDDLYIYFTGKKTYDAKGSGQSASCKIGWKLYDSNNNVIADGTAYTLSLAEGEGFIKTKDTAYNCIEPGGSYRLVIMNVN